MANNDLYFFDLMKTGRSYSGSKDVAIIANTNAVIESIHNILLTEPGDRPMNPEFGIALSRYLFEPIVDYVAKFMADDITKALTRFEPRIKDINVTVDALPDLNTFDITVSFSIAYSAETLTAEVRLNKIR